MYCDKICLNLNKYWISPYHKRLVFISISFPTYIQLSVQSVEPITATVLHTEGHLLKVKPFISALFPQNDMEKEAKCGKFSFCFSREPSPHRPHRIKVFHLVSLSAQYSVKCQEFAGNNKKINKLPDHQEEGGEGGEGEVICVDGPSQTGDHASGARSMQIKEKLVKFSLF